MWLHIFRPSSAFPNCCENLECKKPSRWTRLGRRTWKREELRRKHQQDVIRFV